MDENVKEFDFDSLTDEELFDGLNDDIPDAGAEQDAAESEEPETEESVEDEEDADQQDSEDEDDSGEEEDSSDDGDTEEAEEEEKEEVPDQKFTLKHLDEVREVDRDEVVELAQKGMDYDRIRSERDTMKPRLEELEAFLKRIAGDQSIEDLIDSTLAKLDVADAEKRGEELDEVEQFKKLRIERVKRETKNPPPPKEEEKTEEEKEKERLGKSIKRFLKEYPTVKAEDVPKEVWIDYKNGRADLLECYQLYENKKLKDELKTLKQNQKNKERSTGSKKSAGKKTVDKWFDGWPDD
jgi:hypothetical protein